VPYVRVWISPGKLRGTRHHKRRSYGRRTSYGRGGGYNSRRSYRRYNTKHRQYIRYKRRY